MVLALIVAVMERGSRYYAGRAQFVTWVKRRNSRYALRHKSGNNSVATAQYLPFGNEQEFWLAHKAKQEVGPAWTDPRDIDAAIYDRGCDGADGCRNPSTPGTVGGNI
jgi:hypothetical protein